MPRYVIHPGYVISQYDGQRHFIDFHRLVSLYRVPRSQCVRYPEGDTPQDRTARKLWTDEPDDIHLYPRSRGNYELPK